MSIEDIRSGNRAWLSSRDIDIPDSLPLLEVSVLRPLDQVIGRLLALNAVVAVSYGFRRAKAVAWIASERLEKQLTSAESGFLESGDGNVQDFRHLVEAMWALAWTVSCIDALDFWKTCDDNFVALLPDLKVAEPVEKWRQLARLRDIGELRQKCDLAYCLHWSIRQAKMERRKAPSRLRGSLIAQRRRALEWVLSAESWDAISLDT